MTKLAPQFNWMLHDRPFSDWLRLQPSDYQAPPWSNKWGEKCDEGNYPILTEQKAIAAEQIRIERAKPRTVAS